MPYIGRSSNFGVRTRFLYTATASQTTFSGTDTQNLTLSYSDSNFIDVHQNGVLLKVVDDYTATSGTSVVLATGATASDVIEITVYDVFSIANHIKKTGDAMAGALTNIDIDGTELVLDADGDTSITADTDDQIDFKTGGTDRVVIDSSGNVGIGITSPTFSSGNGIHLADSFFVGFGDGASGRPDFQIGFGGTNLDIRCGNGADTADISIDANGNLKIISGNIQLGASGSETGQIEINSTRLLLRSTGDASGLRFDGSAYTPFKNGSQADGTVDLGSASGKYKDLYLGGGLLVGGTGSANTLDDYEEGTVDISSLSYSTSGGATTHSGNQALNYTKVGRLVHINGNIHINDANANGNQSGYLQIPLPFASPSGNTYRAVGQAGHYSHDESSVWLIEGGTSVATFRFAYQWDTPTISDNDTAVVSITYQTAT